MAAPARPTVLFTTVIAPGSAPLTARQTEILTHVTVAGGALSTSDVRVRVNEQRHTPLVAEQVYRALRALQDRGLVERVHIHGTNKAHWQEPSRAVQEAS
jgi:Fe2+ or Zn2+ uptake regulation protein